MQYGRRDEDTATPSRRLKTNRPIRRTMGGYRKTMGYPQCYGDPYKTLEIQVLDA
jgi:hypothetical protein